MSYFEQYKKYKNKYRKLKVLLGGLNDIETVSLRDIFYEERLKDSRSYIAKLLKQNFAILVRNIFSLLFNRCGKEGVIRNISIDSILITINKKTNQISITVNNIPNIILCEQMNDMREIFREINNGLEEIRKASEYIDKCVKDTKMNEDYRIWSDLHFFVKKKNNAIYKYTIEIMGRDKTVNGLLNALEAKKEELKKKSTDIILKTKEYYLSPETLAFAENNIDSNTFANILIYRDTILSYYKDDYESQYSLSYPIKIKDQIKEYNERDILKSEKNGLVRSLYSPPEEIGKLKDYIFKIEIYALGLVLMYIINFIETNLKSVDHTYKIDNKYKSLVVGMTHYDIRTRYNLMKCQDIIEKF